MVKISCPKCKAKKVYLLSNGKRKCSHCKYEFKPHLLPLHLTRDQWREIIRWFLIEQSSQNIALRTDIERRRALCALTIVRTVLTKDVPEIFSGTVEVDETYLGGQWKNKRRPVRDQGSKRGRGTTKQPVFGILCRDGSVWAEVVDDVSAETLQPLISKKVTIGSTVCSDTWKAYTGIASRGYVHRLVNHGEHQYSDGKGNHINGFRGILGLFQKETRIERRDKKRETPSLPR
jgi:transposase